MVADATRSQTSMVGGGALGVALALVAGWIDRSLRRDDAMAAASGGEGEVAVTDPSGWSRGADQYSDPTSIPGMLGGAAPVSGGFPVAAQPPLAGYPAPGSGSSASVGGVDPSATAYAGPDPGAPYAGAPYPAHPYPGTYPAQPYPGTPYPGSPHPGGFPVPPYSGGYPGLSYPAGPSRPGTITAAAVLAFVTAGLDLVGGLGAFGAADEGTGMGDWRRQYLWLAGVAALVAGGLLIAGGVQMFRSRVGLLLAGAITTAADALYWLVAFGFYGSSGLDGEVLGTYAVIFLALAVLMVALAYSTSAQRWRSAVAWYGAGPGRAAAPAHR